MNLLTQLERLKCVERLEQVHLKVESNAHEVIIGVAVATVMAIAWVVAAS